jgi:hypothetical protein
MGCATASKGGDNPDANNRRDGSLQFDAPRNIDAPSGGGPDAAVAFTITETANDTVAGGVTIACYDTNTLSPTYGNTADNIWYRAYQLSDFPAINGGFHVTGVTFGIEECSAAPQITVKIGKYSGALGGTTISTTQITPLTQATITPANTTGSTVMVPMTTDIVAGGKFVVQIVVPDDTQNGYFFLGSTNGTQTQPGYWSSSACSQSTPTTTSGNAHAIIDVVGTY